MVILFLTRDYDRLQIGGFKVKEGTNSHDSFGAVTKLLMRSINSFFCLCLCVCVCVFLSFKRISSVIVASCSASNRNPMFILNSTVVITISLSFL